MWQHLSLMAAGAWLLVSCVPANGAVAASFRESFTGSELTSRARVSHSTGRVELHRREADGGIEGSGCEHLRVTTSRLGSVVEWDHAVPPCRLIDELTISISVRSNLPGIRVAARVVFPHQRDPRTGGTLVDTLRGTPATRRGRWQELKLNQMLPQLRERLVLLRARLKLPQLDSRDAYLDRVLLQAEPPPGQLEMWVDELSIGPVISPAATILGQVSVAESNEPRREMVAIRLDRMTVRGSPFFPRIVPYHGESPEVLRKSGANLILVKDHRNTKLIRQLRAEGLWVMAEPPKPRAIDGSLIDRGQATLIPFGEETSGILCWYLRTQLTPKRATKLFRWADQVRAADRRYHRPVLADVVGLEHLVSRHRILPAISRKVIQTGYPLKLYSRWLADRRSRTRPGSLSWTWVWADSAPLVLEPEQIELQVRAALATGYRGIGFWKTERLDSDRTGGRERQLMVGLINRELKLLEPWLSTSTLIGSLPVRIGRPLTSAVATKPRQRGRRVRARQVSVGNESMVRVQGPRIDRRLQAALFRTDFGRLLLPTWSEENAQFVPGQMAVADVAVVVPGGDETATAWEISLTGLRSLPLERVTGGVEVRLERLDRSSVILLTSDQHLVTRLREKIVQLAPEAARMILELAQRKLERTRGVDRELTELGVPLEDGTRLLSRAATCLVQAATELDRRRFGRSRYWSDSGLQLIRILQRSHWENAVQKSVSGVDSPWSRCFQTLPAHWKLQQVLSRQEVHAEPRLDGGDFEDLDRMVSAGWSSVRERIAELAIQAELYPYEDGVGRCLRLSARTRFDAAGPRSLPVPVATVTSPGVSVEAGELVRISGRVRLVRSRHGGLDGGVIMDSLGGADAALHCRRPGGWRKFAMIRRARSKGSVRVVVSLEGVAEIRVDDLQIEVIPGRLASSDRSPTVNAQTPR